MPNPTISHLKLCIPGQTDTWYQRIAAEVTAGRMPLPQILEPEPVPIAAVIVGPPRFVVVAEAVPLATVIIPAPQPVAVMEPPQPAAKVQAPPKLPKQPQFLLSAAPLSPPKAPPAPKPAAPPVPASSVPLQASQHQLKQAAKSARAKDSQRSKPQRPKTHPPLELITRLGGDYKAADRLFLKLQLLYPGRNDHWIWDKALWDLHRDRM